MILNGVILGGITPFYFVGFDMNDDITEILNQLDIAAYLDREGINYREAHGSSGAQLNVQTCPACGGDQWKVFLNVETGLGNCFSGSCEIKFNKWKFIKAHTALDGRNLMEHIKAVGIEIGWRPPRKSVVAVHTDIKDLKLPHSHALPIKERNLAYLQNRGIGLDTARYFHLRYCQKGLFKYQVDGANRFVPFDRRIIIPVFDLDGTMVSFQGRDITGTAEKKYLFPNGFSSTGEHLYNGHNVHGSKCVVVGEGVFDVMAIKIALDQDPELRDIVPVGTFGKHLSINQLAKFSILKERGITDVVFMWDGELAAVDAAVDAALQVKGLGLRARVAILPDGKDPNEVPANVVRQAYWSAKHVELSTAALIKMSFRMR